MQPESVQQRWRAGIINRILSVGLLCGILFAGSPSASAGSVQFSLPQPVMGDNQIHVESWLSLKFAGTVHQKYDFSCGSAALATLLTHVYRDPTSEETVFKSMFRHGDRSRIEKLGFSLLDMKHYLSRHGIQSGGFKASFAKLISLRVPAIVLINYHGYHHFVVVRGARDGQVLISDPSLGLRTEPVRQFERQWSNIFFIVLNDVPLARVAFNNPAIWHHVAGPPIGLAQFQIRDLAFPPGGFRNLTTF